MSATNGNWKIQKRPGGWVIATQGGQRVRGQMIKQGAKVWFQLSGQHGHYEKKSSASQRKGAGPSLDETLVSQFPGKIRKVLVKNGESVREGQGLLLVEAMKMEFTIQAPIAGSVTRVLVTEGQQVSPGQRWLEFQPEVKTSKEKT